MEKYYALVSAILLLWVASFWSNKNWSNIFLKSVFAAAGFAGAVVVAKEFLL